LIYFIVNPVAGSGKAKAAVPIIEKIMRERNSNIEYSFIYTDTPGDFKRVSGFIDLDAAKTIVCVGGDGTIQEYVGLIAGRDINFGVIPAGSGNDLIYSMPCKESSIPCGDKKFPSFEEKIKFYTEKILKGETMSADAVMINGEKYFFNIGGTGIDIQVLIDALPLKKFFGGTSYLLSLIKNVVTYKTEEMTLTIDGTTETEKFTALVIANGSYYGGHMRIAPPAVIDDGFITLCKIIDMPRLKMMAMFPRVKSGKHAALKEVSFVNCSSVKLEFDGKKIINLDGNLEEFESPMTFEIVKGAVKLII
jgi:YegS/Rv2252/BmrU family lipid kinase